MDQEPFYIVGFAAGLAVYGVGIVAVLATFLASIFRRPKQ